MPIGDEIPIGSYVQFLCGLDAALQANALMKTHFVKGASRPLAGSPEAIVLALRGQFGAAEKDQPEFDGARKLAVGAINAKVMPAYRKQMTDESNADVRKRAEKMKQLQVKRAKAIAAH